jgi:hypothetical protein
MTQDEDKQSGKHNTENSKDEQHKHHQKSEVIGILICLSLLSSIDKVDFRNNYLVCLINIVIFIDILLQRYKAH